MPIDDVDMQVTWTCPDTDRTFTQECRVTYEYEFSEADPSVGHMSDAYMVTVLTVVNVAGEDVTSQVDNMENVETQIAEAELQADTDYPLD